MFNRLFPWLSPKKYDYPYSAYAPPPPTAYTTQWPYVFDSAHLVTGSFPDPMTVPESIDMGYLKDGKGIYLLYGGQDYDGEEHIGIFYTLGAAITKFAPLHKSKGYDYGKIYTMGKTKLRAYLVWDGKYNTISEQIEYRWRRAGK